MPINPVPKRVALARRAVNAADQMVKAIVELREVAFDLAQTGGQFQDADFEGSDIQHVDAQKLNDLCSHGIMALGTASASPVNPAAPEGATLDDLMRSVKRG